jgi:hypothetical protein
MHTVKNSCTVAVTQDNGTTIVVSVDNGPVVPFYLTESTGLETVEVTAKTGTTYTITRAIYGTQTNLVGKTLQLRIMAEHVIELQDAAAVVKPVGDWVIDTKNLRDANDSGKKVQLAAGTFFIEGDGDEIIRKTNTARWDGAGLGATFLKVRSTVPDTRDIFHLLPKQLDAIGYLNRGFELCNFAIIPESGRPGRYAVHLDVDDVYDEYEEITEAMWFTSHFHFHHLHLDYCGGRSIRMSNTLPKMDGYFCGKVTDSLIWSGIQCVGGGDSLQFIGNTIAGENIGIECSLRAGANVIAIKDNNITARGGAMKLHGLRYKIVDNNVEVFENGGTAPVVEPDALIWITGSDEADGKDKLSRIEGNTIYNLLGTTSAACKIENSNATKITNNRFHGGAVGSDLIITNTCTGVIIHPDNEYTNTRKVDNGVGTVYV